MDSVAGKVAADSARGLFDWIRRWFYRPILEIRVCHDTGRPGNVRMDDASPPNMKPAWFHHLEVVNKGRSVAKTCVAQLVNVEPTKGIGYVLAKPCRLLWAHEGDFRPVDIHPTDPPRKLELLYIFHKDGRLVFHIQMPPVPAGFTNTFTRAEYDILVRVTTEDGNRSEAGFRLTPGEKEGVLTIIKL